MNTSICRKTCIYYYVLIDFKVHKHSLYLSIRSNTLLDLTTNYCSVALLLAAAAAPWWKPCMMFLICWDPIWSNPILQTNPARHSNAIFILDTSLSTVKILIINCVRTNLYVFLHTHKVPLRRSFSLKFICRAHILLAFMANLGAR